MTLSKVTTATSGHVIAERSQSIEHYGCRGTSGTEGELRRHLIVVVTDADRIFKMPGPEEESPDRDANLLNLRRIEDVSYPHRTRRYELLFGHRQFGGPVLGPDDSREELSLPGGRRRTELRPVPFMFAALMDCR